MAERKPKPFQWTAPRRRAAALLAEDELTDAEIIDRLGVGRQTLYDWKRAPAFAAEVQRLAAELGGVAERRAIGRRARRVAALQERWEKMRAVIEARGREYARVPGGASGLLVRTERAVGSGPGARVVEEYAVDVGLLRELREHEKQAAQELGQWTEKKEHAGGLTMRVVERLVGDGDDADDDV